MSSEEGTAAATHSVKKTGESRNNQASADTPTSTKKLSSEGAVERQVPPGSDENASPSMRQAKARLDFRSASPGQGWTTNEFGRSFTPNGLRNRSNTPKSSSRKGGSTQKVKRALYAWEKNYDEEDELAEKRKAGIAARVNCTTGGVQGEFVPSKGEAGLYVKKNASPPPSQIVDFRIVMSAADFEQMEVRRRRVYDLKKHKERFAGRQRKNDDKKGCFATLAASTPFVDKTVIEKAIWQR